jgi:hypothetical protein
MGRRKAVRSKRMSSTARSVRMKAFLKTETDTAPVPDERMIISTQAIKNIINLVQEHSISCKKSDLIIIANNPTNLIMKCNTCKRLLQGRKDCRSAHHLTVKDAIAAGILSSGIGYSAVKTLFSSLEMPMLGKSTYQKAERRVGAKLEEAVQENYRKNGEMERMLAIQAGDVYQADGKEYPYITVTVDGEWSKRSYGHSYNANAGVGVIIG